MIVTRHLSNIPRVASKPDEKYQIPAESCEFCLVLIRRATSRQAEGRWSLKSSHNSLPSFRTSCPLTPHKRLGPQTSAICPRKTPDTEPPPPPPTPTDIAITAAAFLRALFSLCKHSRLFVNAAAAAASSQLQRT